MGAPTTTRVEPRRASIGALVGALGLASGCGPTVSLDESAAASTGTTTAVASTSASTSTGEAVDTTTPGDAPPDAPLPDLPPPAACPAECTVELPLVWSWDDEPLPDREPLDPREPPDPRDPPGPRDPGGTPTRSLAAMARAADGSLVVADLRNGSPWLTRVDRDGGLVWSIPFDLVCDCQIVDLAFDPYGQLVVLSEGTFGDEIAWLVLMSVTLLPDDVYVDWQTWEPLYGTFERPGRVGSALPLADGSVAVLAVEVGLDVDALEKDWFEVHYYVYGVQEGVWLLDTQLALDPPRRPQGVALPRDELVMTLPGGRGTGDYVAWMEPWASFVSAVEPLPGPVDAIVVSPDGSVVVAGIERPARASPVLHAAALPHGSSPAWLHAVDVPGATTGAPALAVHADGSASVAVRTASEGAGEPAVSLVRLTADGTPAWSTELPLAAEGSPTPVALSLADDEQALVLAAIVDGRLHLEQREQGCRCDR